MIFARSKRFLPSLSERDSRLPLVVRLLESHRDDPQAPDRTLIPTAAGQRPPLTQIVRLEETTSLATIRHP